MVNCVWDRVFSCVEVRGRVEEEVCFKIGGKRRETSTFNWIHVILC